MKVYSYFKPDKGETPIRFISEKLVSICSDVHLHKSTEDPFVIPLITQDSVYV